MLVYISISDKEESPYEVCTLKRSVDNLIQSIVLGVCNTIKEVEAICSTKHWSIVEEEHIII